MTIERMKELANYAAHRSAPENFSVETVDKALADGFKELCGSINLFNKNKYDIFQIIVENADTIVPQKVMAAMGQFAEVRQSANGERVLFKRGKASGRARAKRFLTQVGLSGVYETFRLDSETFTVAMKSIGGAVSIDFQRMIDGAESLAEFMDVLAEAQEDAIYAEVQKALIAAANQMPQANHVSGNYSAADLQNVVNTVKAYGGSAVIIASPEFIAAMGPDAIVAGGTGYKGVYAPQDIDDIHNSGLIRLFRGSPVIELKQSFADETNTQKMIHPQYAYVLPTGREKVVKVVMEGQTQIWDFVNADQSVEIHTYKMIGVGIEAFNNWGVYQNTAIPADNWYNDGSLDLDVDLHIEP